MKNNIQVYNSVSELMINLKQMKSNAVLTTVIDSSSLDKIVFAFAKAINGVY